VIWMVGVLVVHVPLVEIRQIRSEQSRASKARQGGDGNSYVG